jgi:hypothetical protein
MQSNFGEFLDKGDAKWIVIRGQLRGHNNMPFGWPTSSQPIGHSVVGCPQGVIGAFQLLLISNIFFNIVPLIMEFTHVGIESE